VLHATVSAVFPKPAEVLAAREGTIAATPLPLLLQCLFAEERTVTLELRLRGLEKRIQFEDGSPVACRSNLLHETLGKFLVGKGKLTEAQYQRALSESVQSGRKMGELLVQQQLVSPFELYKLMQANLALRILDAFRWGEATWRLLGESEPAELALRMNPAQLVLTGVSGFISFDVVATQLAFTDEQRFALVSRPVHAVADLKLSPREARLVQVLRRRPTFDEVVAGTGHDVEEAMRRLYAFAVLGIVDFAEEVPEVGAAPRSTAASSPPPAAIAASTSPATAYSTPTPTATATSTSTPTSTPTSTSTSTSTPTPTSTSTLPEESDELRNALAAAYLDHRGMDPFALLGVSESADAAALRRAFLALADRFSPLRFTSADLRDKAEALLAVHARAYGALSDPDQAALWRKRRAAAAEKGAGAARPSAADQFRIATNLLDAGTQFAEGRRRLEAGNPRGALEQFQYATDIEPLAAYRAYLAWARYLVDPVRHARLAQNELFEVARTEPSCADAQFFLGEILRAQSRPAEAEEAYRRAFKADPANRRAQELALEMMRAKKAPAR